MSKTKIIIIAVSVIVALGGIAAGLFMVFYRGNTYGIPHGLYAPVDENGNVMDTVLEEKWQIDEDAVEYRYAIGKLIEENGKIYYIYEREINPLKFEMSYDKETKILTVYMPDKFPYVGENKPMKFKRI